jgi:hypothetical protein
MVWQRGALESATLSKRTRNGVSTLFTSGLQLYGPGRCN